MRHIQYLASGLFSEGKLSLAEQWLGDVFSFTELGSLFE